MNYTYLLQERAHMRAGPDAWCFDLWIISETDYTKPTLHAVVDWQDGLMIFQAEGIEPSHWPAISEQISLGLKDAHQKMGSNAIWELS